MPDSPRPDVSGQSQDAMPPQDAMPLIGWREWVCLPELGIKYLKAKIDTGARSSSLHAFDIEPFEQDGQAWVRFKVNPVQRKDDRWVDATAPLIETRSIRSSSGQAQLRPVIRTPLQMFGQRFEIELTLADRYQMGFRMLLGREAFRRRFIIDPGRSFLGGVPKKRKRKRRNVTGRPGSR